MRAILFWLMPLLCWAMPDVEVHTGAYAFHVVDWVGGAIELGRSYHSGGGWATFRHLVLDPLQFDGTWPKVKGIYVPEPSGRRIYYRKVAGGVFAPTAYAAGDVLDAACDPQQNRLEVDSKTHDMTLRLCDGGMRFYEYAWKSWDLLPMYRLRWEMRPSGVRVEYEYEGKGRVASIRSRGVWVTFQYRGGDVVMETSDGHRLEYRGQLLEKVVWDGECLERFAYEKGKLVERVFADGVKESVEYAGERAVRVGEYRMAYRNGETEVVDGRGVRQVFRYMPYPANKVVEVEAFDAAGKLQVRRRWERGPEWQILAEVAVDGEGALIYEKRYERDARGRVVREGERCARYDELNRLVEREGVAYEYWGDTHRLKRRGETEYAYDRLGQLVEERTGKWRTRFGYNGVGDRTWLEESYGENVLRTVEFRLERGKVVEQWVKCGETEFRLGWEYDARGRLVREIDAIGRVREVTEVTPPAQVGCVPEGELDAWGRVARQVLTAEGEEPRVVTYKYDDLGRVLETTMEGITLVTRRDLVGRLVEERTATTVKETTYDERDRPIAIREGTGTTRFRYDDENRLVEQVDPLGRKTKIKYGEGERVTELPLGERVVERLDEQGRRAEVKSRDGTVWYEYVYGERRIEIVDRVNGTKLVRELNGWGEWIKETLPNGLALQRTVDGWGRPVKWVLPDGSEVGVSYEGVHVKEVRRGKWAHRVERRDAAGRPVLAKTAIGLAWTAEYDAAGGMESVAVGGYYAALVARDAVMRPIEVCSSLRGVQRFKYDAQSQLIVEEEKGEERGGECVYDGLNRLIEVQWPEKRVRMTYDPFDRRMTKVVEVLRGGAWCVAQSDRYFYDGEEEMGSARADGSLMELRLLMHGVAVAMEIGGKLYLPLCDLQGNCVGLMNERAEVVEQYAFDPFGRGVAGRYLNPWRYASKRCDEETGMVYFGRRYYVPETRRWLTADPAGEVDGPDLFRYVHNNPVLNRDRNGLFTYAGFDISFQAYWGTPYGTVGFSTAHTGVENALQWSCFAAGAAVQFVGLHFLPPVPFLQSAVIYAGRLLQLNLDPMPTRNPYTQLLKRLDAVDPGRLVFLYASGILNQERDCMQAARWIRERTGAPVLPIWTPSRGFMGDLLDAICLFFGHRTPNAEAFTRKLETAIAECAPESYIVLILHSKGAALGKYALQHMNCGLRGRIQEVVAFGPEKILRGDGYRVTNVVSVGDPVPYFDLFNLMATLLRRPHEVHFVLPRRSPVHHSFQEETYRQAFEEILEGIQRRAA